jgi:hypothetical protein
MTPKISLVVLALAGAVLAGCPDNGSKAGPTPASATSSADPAPKAAGSASAKPGEGGGW